VPQATVKARRRPQRGRLGADEARRPPGSTGVLPPVPRGSAGPRRPHRAKHGLGQHWRPPPRRRRPGRRSTRWQRARTVLDTIVGPASRSPTMSRTMDVRRTARRQRPSSAATVSTRAAERRARSTVRSNWGARQAPTAQRPTGVGQPLTT
jgi:hypothetical protein